jgi:hypothetical protein
VKESK